MKLEDRLKVLRELTATQYAHLISHFPALEARGLTLFLGSRYAEPDLRIMMLGINPGLDGELPADYKLQPVNCLLDDTPDGQDIVFWRNAKRCFNATPLLRQIMEYATYSFCAPFRTVRWCSTPLAQRRVISDLSRPILQQMLSDCRPTAIIVAGRTSVNLLSQIGNLRVTPYLNPAGQCGSKTWGHFIGHGHWGEFDVLQVPHFSYFNSRSGLEDCGRWLERILGLRILKECDEDETSVDPGRE
jgi:hypothetical protein